MKFFLAPGAQAINQIHLDMYSALNAGLKGKKYHFISLATLKPEFIIDMAEKEEQIFLLFQNLNSSQNKLEYYHYLFNCAEHGITLLDWCLLRELVDKARPRVAEPYFSNSMQFTEYLAIPHMCEYITVMSENDQRPLENHIFIDKLQNQKPGYLLPYLHLYFEKNACFGNKRNYSVNVEVAWQYFLANYSEKYDLPIPFYLEKLAEVNEKILLHIKSSPIV